MTKLPVRECWRTQRLIGYLHVDDDALKAGLVCVVNARTVMGRVPYLAFDKVALPIMPIQGYRQTVLTVRAEGHTVDQLRDAFGYRFEAA